MTVRSVEVASPRIDSQRLQINTTRTHTQSRTAHILPPVQRRSMTRRSLQRRQTLLALEVRVHLHFACLHFRRRYAIASTNVCMQIDEWLYGRKVRSDTLDTLCTRYTWKDQTICSSEEALETEMRHCRVRAASTGHSHFTASS